MKLAKLDREVSKLYKNLLAITPLALEMSEEVHSVYKWSVINLLRYLTFRKNDLGEIQSVLSEYGISGLRSGEGYILKNVVDVLKLIKLLRKMEWKPDPDIRMIGYQKSRELRHYHTNMLFNEIDQLCFTEIMVTMPVEAAVNKQLIRDLITEGMEVARINLCHDDAEHWKMISENVRQCSEELGIPCKIVMDLGGPKFRINEIFVSRKGKIQSVDRMRIHSGDKISVIPPLNKGKRRKFKDNKKYKMLGISLNLPSVFSDVKIGDRIYFDDGKVKGVVFEHSDAMMTILIGKLASDGAFLKIEKGVNLPDTQINLASLTDEDILNLPLALEYADIIGYSFVRKAKDVEQLFELLGEKMGEIGIILKIENQEAFENLPQILIKAMQCPKLGVMIARGDLAVEVGAERMSEIQDEIMWICEAAHVPVVWATGVLDRFSKKGIPTRSEITDAACSVRAECVMLNKGPFIVDAVKLLKRILMKMEMHTSKKKSKMRSLNLAKNSLDQLSHLGSKKECNKDGSLVEF